MQTQTKTQRMGSIASGEYLKQGMTVQFQVLGSLYFVMKVDDNKVLLFGEDGIIEHKRREGIYYTIFSGQSEPEAMTNEKSGISHLVINGKSLCGSVGDFSESRVALEVTCKHCNENYKGGK